MTFDYLLTTDGFRKIPHSRSNTAPMRLNSSLSTSTCLKNHSQSVSRSNALEKYKIKSFKESDFKLNDRNFISTQKKEAVQPFSRPVYSVRSISCTPSDMYLNEDVRRHAKHTTAHERRCKSAPVAYRFGDKIELPSYVSPNDFLMHEDLSMGQKQYIWGIARCYSVTQLKEANKRKTQALLHYEYRKRIATRDIANKTKIKLWKDYCDYSQVIKEVSKKGFVRPQSSFSCRVLNGPDHNRHLRVQSSPHPTFELHDGYESGTDDCDSAKRIICYDAATNTDYTNAQDTTTKRKNRLTRPKSAKRSLRKEEQMPSYKSLIEDELVFDINEKMTLFHDLDVEE